MYTKIDAFCVAQSCSIQEAIAQMNANRDGIILVVDEKRCLLGTVTDGDIRRAFLANIPLENSVETILDSKRGTLYEKPLHGEAGKDKQIYLDLLREHDLCHLPILDKEKRVVGLVTSDDFMQSLASLRAVIMAGGKGNRLLPLTEELPKPMLPIGEKPLLEIIIDQLRSAGVRRVNVTTHHMAEVIKQHFGNGDDFGVNISYVSENRPLGTAGALSLLDNLDATTLVINGDVLTQINFKAFLQFHKEHKADLTVGVRAYTMEVPYGVVECRGVQVEQIKEKPRIQFFVNAGIYLLESSVYEFMSSGEECQMTDLIQKLIDEKLNVVSFPIHEYWLDIGSHNEYQLAQEQVKKF